MKRLIFLTALFLGISGISFLKAHASSLAVTSYPNAIQDTTYRAKPPLPTLGPAGSVITDPTFGSKILRVTDENTMVGTSNYYQGRAFLTGASAEQNTFNSNSTKFYITMSGGWNIVYNFNPATLQAACITSMSGSQIGPPSYPCASLPLDDPDFSFTNSNWIYGIVAGAGGHKIISRYDFGAGTTQQLLDIDSVIGYVPTNNGVLDLNVSANEKINVDFGDIQDRAPFDLVYDTNSSTYHILNVASSTIDGKPVGWSILGSSGGTGIHNARISKDGRYVELTIQGATPSGDLIWDVKAGQVYWVTNSSSGHFVLGYGQYINQSNIVGNDDYAVSFLIRGLDPASIGNPSSLLPINTTVPYFSFDSHPSWNNDQPSSSIPFITSFDYDANANTSSIPAQTYGGEIDGIATDGSGVVWRFAFNRSWYTGNFWDSSRGNVSQDGKYFMFNSNWQTTLGSDPVSHLFREDAFIVDLTSAHNPVSGTPPVVNVTSPAASATISGTATLSATASDASSSVASVQFKVDGGLVGNAITTAPYSYSLNTLTLVNGAHTISAVAYDPAGDMASSPNVPVTVNNPDTTPPTIPTGLTAGAITTSSISFLWSASTDNIGVMGYKIYRAGSQVGTSTTTGYTNAGLTPSTTYRYTVSAYDAAGNNSAQSAALSLTTLAVVTSTPDTTPPTIPTGLTATVVSPNEVDLSWSPSTDNVGVKGYEVFRGGILLATIQNILSYKDTSVAPGTGYSYAVLAYDAAGNVSVQSTPAAATTPNLPVTTSGGSSGGGTIVVVPPPPVATTTSATGGVTTLPTDTASLTALLQSLIAQLNSLISQENASLVPQLTRNLTVGSIGNDVSLLQEFLDFNGYPVASSGLGSAGDLGTYFGGKTAAALAKFQSANGLPATGFFGSQTRQYLQEKW